MRFKVPPHCGDQQTIPILSLMQPLFIVFDLDGTLTDEKSGELLSGVMDALVSLKAEGHYLSICSNNVLAKEIVSKHNMLDFFDYVIGHTSSSFKAVELLQCWSFYRFLFRTKQIRWKVHLNRIVFVDNDEENLHELARNFRCVSYYNSVGDMVRRLLTWTKPRGVAIQSAKEAVYKEHGNVRYCQRSDSLVYISSLARQPGRRGGTNNMRFHSMSTCGALVRCKSFTQLTEHAALECGHTQCQICAYNMISKKTEAFCVKAGTGECRAMLGSDTRESVTVEQG
jgi:hypothetical protein